MCCIVRSPKRRDTRRAEKPNNMMTHQQKSAMPDTTDATDASDATTDAIESPPPAMPLTTRGISVVLPAHNEEAVLAVTLDKCVATLSEIAPDYEVIVVD